MKLLCTADLHLGRRPSSKVPKHLAVDRAELGPTAAWNDFVELAIRDKVDAVLIAGDLVDQENDFFESFGVLRSGVQRLRAEDVDVIAIAGNHDGEILPRLAQAIPEITVLGLGGTWQRVTLTDGEGASLDIVGWSMPARHHDVSPFRTPNPFVRERPTIGLLHADLDQSVSRYAPVQRTELEACGYDVWLLGHVHRPDDLGGPGSIGYLGPPVGTDPGEPGPRGPWRLSLGKDGIIEMEHLHRAPLIWQSARVDVTNLETETEVEQAVLMAVTDIHDEASRLPHAPMAVGLEVRLEGRTRIGPRLRTMFQDQAYDDLYLPSDHTHTFVYRVTDHLQLAIDLEQLARQDDPVGLLARRVLTVREGGDAAKDIIRRARPRLEAARRSKYYAPLSASAPLDDAAIAHLVERAAIQLIDQLIDQRSQGRESP